MKNLVLFLGILIFLTLIPISFFYGTSGFIPDLFIFMGLLLFFRWTYGVWRLNIVAYTLLILGMFTHACGIFGWYGHSPIFIQWDHITHFFGLLPFGLLFWGFFEQWMDDRLFTRKNLLLVIAVFFAAFGVGALIELSEFLGFLNWGFGEGAFQFGKGDGFETITGASDKINDLGGGWINTGWDLVFNTSGILVGIAVMIVARVLRKNQSPR